MEFRKQSHCVYHCEYHIVLPTRYRRNIFNNGVFAWMTFKLKEITSYYPELVFKEMNHDKDHIHLLVSIPPKMSVGSVIRIIKSNTARGLKIKFPFIKKVYWGTDSVWSDGYLASTVGLNEAVIKRYIERQGKDDAGQTLFGTQ